MKIFVAFPSYDGKAAQETAGRWLAMGYQPLVIMNKESVIPNIPAIVIKVEAYEGYYRSMNWACHHLFKERRADIVICAGDRIHPPPHARGHEIATTVAAKFQSGFGIMQPVKGRVLGLNRLDAPWICRRFYLETYGGEGPFWPRYFQFFGGDELAMVAQKLGCVWYRDDVAQPTLPKKLDFIRGHNVKEYTENDRAEFDRRSLAEFPGAFPAGKSESGGSKIVVVGG